MTANWHIVAPGGQVVDVLHMPHQQVRPWVMQWVRRVRDERLMKRRGEHVGNIGFDWQITHDMARQLTPEHRTLWRRIATL
eukprot:8816305-Alexandrium_andersonii.AAC.1